MRRIEKANAREENENQAKNLQKRSRQILKISKMYSKMLINRGCYAHGKLAKLGWQKLIIIAAALDIVLGIIFGAIFKAVPAGIIVGVLAAAVTGVIVFALGGGVVAGHTKGDKYKKLFMNLPIGFAQAKIITDSLGNSIGYCIQEANERFGSYFNLDASDYQDKILGESKIEVLQDINAWFTAYNTSGTKEGDFMDVEITMEKLGKVFNTVMYKSEADYINMVVIDITDQKETENKLSAAIEDANAAYKTQAEFLANMSHEIRTPINGILGMLQLTLMADDLQADYRDNLLTAKGCADNLLRLINDILDISKLEAGKYNLKEEIFDVRAAIEETVAAQVPTATNKGLALDCTFGNNIPKLVKGDGQRIQQILNCLLSNALKFTSEGSVRVKIAAIDAEKRISTCVSRLLILVSVSRRRTWISCLSGSHRSMVPIQESMAVPDLVWLSPSRLQS